MNARSILWGYAAGLVLAAAVAVVSAPAGAKVTTAWAVPGGCALLAAVCGAFSATWGRVAGTWLAFLFAAMVTWRATATTHDYLRNVLIGLAVLSVVAGVLLLRLGRRPQSLV